MGAGGTGWAPGAGLRDRGLAPGGSRLSLQTAPARPSRLFRMHDAPVDIFCKVTHSDTHQGFLSRTLTWSMGDPLPSCALAKSPASLGSVLHCQLRYIIAWNSMNSLKPVHDLGKEDRTRASHLAPGTSALQREGSPAPASGLVRKAMRWVQWHSATCCPHLSPGGSKPSQATRAPLSQTQAQGEVLEPKPGLPPTGDNRENPSERAHPQGRDRGAFPTRLPPLKAQWLAGVAVSEYPKWRPKATELYSPSSGVQPLKSRCQPGH